MVNYGAALTELAREVYDVNESKGFWDEPYDDDNPLTIPAKLALIHDEVSEALQVHRAEYDDDEADPISGMTPMQEDDFTEEIADGIIRYLDLAGAYELDIGDSLMAKIEKNRSRPFKHNRRY